MTSENQRHWQRHCSHGLAASTGPPLVGTPTLLRKKLLQAQPFLRPDFRLQPRGNVLLAVPLRAQRPEWQLMPRLLAPPMPHCSSVPAGAGGLLLRGPVLNPELYRDRVVTRALGDDGESVVRFQTPFLLRKDEDSQLGTHVDRHPGARPLRRRPGTRSWRRIAVTGPPCGLLTSC